MEFHQKVRFLRAEIPLPTKPFTSQAQLARLLGLTAYAIYSYEKKLSFPYYQTLEKLEKLAKKYNIAISFIDEMKIAKYKKVKLQKKKKKIIYAALQKRS